MINNYHWTHSYVISYWEEKYFTMNNTENARITNCICYNFFYLYLIFVNLTNDFQDLASNCFEFQPVSNLLLKNNQVKYDLINTTWFYEIFVLFLRDHRSGFRFNIDDFFSDSLSNDLFCEITEILRVKDKVGHYQEPRMSAMTDKAIMFQILLQKRMRTPHWKL